MSDNTMIPVNKNDWVKYRLMSVAPEIAKKVGDFDNDGTPGTTKDYAEYYKKYRRMIGKQAPFFSAAARFDRIARGGDNTLIHNLMSVAAVAMYPQDVATAYAHLGKAYRAAKAALRRAKTDEERAAALIKAVGRRFKPLTLGETRPHRVFDEPIIFAAALAKVFGVKGLSVVQGPRERLYLRYTKDGVHHCMNAKGASISLASLKAKLIPARKVREGVYLKPLGEKALVAAMVFNRSKVWMYRGKGPNAQRDLMASKQFLPKSPLVWKVLGNLWSRAKDMPRAVSCYKAALRLDSGYPPVLNNLGLFARGQKKIQEAMRLLMLADKFEPGYSEANSGLCGILTGMKRYNEAIRRCTKALNDELTPESAALSYVQRGEAKFFRNPFDVGFVHDYYKALLHSPEFAEVAVDKTAMFIACKDRLSSREYGLIKKHLDEAVAGYHKGHVEALARLARGFLQYKVGDYTNAVDEFELGLEALDRQESETQDAGSMDNSRPAFLTKIAKIYYTHFDDPRSALDLYDEALSYKMDDGEKAEALFDRGVVNFKVGNFTDALEDLSDAVHADPGRYAYPSLGVVARGIEANAFGEEELDIAYGLLSKAIEADPANKADYTRAREALFKGEGFGSESETEFHYPLQVTPLTLEHEMDGKKNQKIVVH